MAKDCDHDDMTFRCVKFIKNYDADTVTFDIPNVHPLIGSEISIRVRGLDAAEMKTKNICEKAVASRAQETVAAILKNAKIINLKNVGRDKYFRILADVEVDGKMLKDTLLEKHYAYKYEGGTKRKVDWCEIDLRKPAQEETK
jgi:endonuclease YncB( thermonuclease family)